MQLGIIITFIVGLAMAAFGLVVQRSARESSSDMNMGADIMGGILMVIGALIIGVDVLLALVWMFFR